MRILIAEDDFIGRKLLQKYLVRFGECVTAINGQEAIEAFHTAHREGKPFQLVCLDIMMPVVDGIVVLQTIREYENQMGIAKTDQAKIIMTSALNDRKTIAESHNSGCEAYVWKPIDLDLFHKTLVKLDLVDATGEGP